MPTTVLAQDDSAVGVKNGVNAFGKKNFVGTFAPPHAVLNDVDMLVTLSDRDWRAGISEAIKVALLKDAAFFAWIEAHATDLRERSLDAMAPLVHRSAAHHLQHIATSGDPFELGSSRPLDFGHWAAHKLEQLTDYELRHGEAVADRHRARFDLQPSRRQPPARRLAPDRRAVRGRRATDLAPRRSSRRGRGPARRAGRPARSSVSTLEGGSRSCCSSASARASRSTKWTRRWCWRLPTSCGAASKEEDGTMAAHAGTSPLSQRELIAEYFMEHRVQVLELAAFLDRLDRARELDADGRLPAAVDPRSARRRSSTARAAASSACR